MNLNHARLPVPPLGHASVVVLKKSMFFQPWQLQSGIRGGIRGNGAGPEFEFPPDMGVNRSPGRPWQGPAEPMPPLES